MKDKDAKYSANWIKEELTYFKERIEYILKRIQEKENALGLNKQKQKIKKAKK